MVRFNWNRCQLLESVHKSKTYSWGELSNFWSMKERSMNVSILYHSVILNSSSSQETFFMKNSLRFVFVYQRLLSMSAKTLNPNQTICTDSAEQSRAARSTLNRAEESFTSSAISCRSDINRLCYTKGPGMDTLLSRRVL